MNPRCFILSLLVAYYQFHACAADTNLIVEINSRGVAGSMDSASISTNLIATGEWSKSVSDDHGNILRGRLLVCEGAHLTTHLRIQPGINRVIQIETNASVGTHPTNQIIIDRWSTASVYLEIQDVTETNQHPTQIYFDVMKGVIFKLCDAQGAAADNLRSGSYRGGLHPPIWATLPVGGPLRLSPNKGIGRGEGRDGDLRLFFYDGSWIIPSGDTNAWFLSATLAPPPTNSSPHDSNAWQGTLEFPAVKLSAVNH